MTAALVTGGLNYILLASNLHPRFCCCENTQKSKLVCKEKNELCWFSIPVKHIETLLHAIDNMRYVQKT